MEEHFAELFTADSLAENIILIFFSIAIPYWNGLGWAEKLILIFWQFLRIMVYKKMWPFWKIFQKCG